MRLDKYLADCGVATRSQVKVILKQKRVTVNGIIQTNGKLQVNEQTDVIVYDGKPLTHETFVYYLMNKPKGVISATEDARHATVLDLLDDEARRRGVFPVGRLDIDTHGLLLLTDNGALAHAMLSPKKHVEKTYRAHVDGVMTEQDQRAFQEGITLDDGFRCLPGHLVIESVDDAHRTCVVTITIQEGKFHQVKRMVQACGKKVMDLQRVTMGPLQLDTTLERGAYRALREDELQLLAAYQVPL